MERVEEKNQRDINRRCDADAQYNRGGCNLHFAVIIVQARRSAVTSLSLSNSREENCALSVIEIIESAFPL